MEVFTGADFDGMYVQRRRGASLGSTRSSTAIGVGLRLLGQRRRRGLRRAEHPFELVPTDP
jgi:hypothetical protein